MPGSESAAHCAAARLFSLGFRPFFLLATGFAVLLSLLWYAAYVHAWQPAGTRYPPMSWHAHEMVFGYSVAVVSGFLLTAAHNWTRLPTLHGAPLAGLAALWLAARLLPLSGDACPLWLLAAVDCGFGLWLCAALSVPICKARQWRQMAVISKLALLVASNLGFYIGLLGSDPEVARLAILCGVYLLLSLILMIGRRVIPGFIERGVQDPVRLRNSAAVDAVALVLFVAFALVDLFADEAVWSAALAAALFAVHAWRLSGWHTRQLWNKSLLWVLYVAYAFITAGFALKAVQPWYTYPASFAVHAFAYGGIGLMTAGMLSRVALGHTGRDLRSPPASLAMVYGILTIGALTRVVAPVIAPTMYVTWVAMAALLWAGSFALLFYTLLPVLTGPRVSPPDA
ncbi:MAG: NnrS family protein [Gammaproteobacteria bacterium]|nr:NnrS family protein [Gammaproteobacteria bacterium]